MYQCQGAYKYDDGTIEGFNGFGVNAKNARKEMEEKIKKRITQINKITGNKFVFNKRNYLKSLDGLTEEEKQKIQKDWNKK